LPPPCYAAPVSLSPSFRRALTPKSYPSFLQYGLPRYAFPLGVIITQGGTPYRSCFKFLPCIFSQRPRAGPAGFCFFLAFSTLFFGRRLEIVDVLVTGHVIASPLPHFSPSWRYGVYLERGPLNYSLDHVIIIDFSFLYAEPVAKSGFFSLLPFLSYKSTFFFFDFLLFLGWGGGGGFSYNTFPESFFFFFDKSLFRPRSVARPAADPLSNRVEGRYCPPSFLFFLPSFFLHPPS